MLEELIIFALCALAGLGCLGGAAGIALSPETLDVDKIFSIIACLIVALIFFSIAGWMWSHTRLRTLLRGQPASDAKAEARPAAAGTERIPQEAGKAS